MNLMATYQSFPAAPPAVIAGALRFGNNQVLVSETQPGATPGQFLVATSASTLGWTTISSTTYADGLNTSTPAQPVQTASTTPLAGQYLRAFLPTNAIWDWGEVYGVKIGTVALTSQTATCADDNSTSVGKSASSANGCAFGKSAVVTTSGVAVGWGASTTAGISIGNGTSSTTGSIVMGAGCTSSGLGSVVIGYLAAYSTCPTCVVIGSVAIAEGSAVDSIAIGSGALTTGAQAVSIGRSATTSGTNGIAIGNSVSATGTNAIVIGINAGNGTNGAGALVIGQSNITSSGAAGAQNGTMIGYQNAISTTAAGNANRLVIVGANNTWNCNGSGSVTKGICVGNDNTMTNSAGTTGVNNIILGNDNTVTTGVNQSVTIGGNLTNSTAASFLYGTNGNPLRYQTNNGIDCSKVVVTTSSGGAAGAAGILGGIYQTTQTGTVNLTLPTGTNLDANADITNNLWVGMCFRWMLVHSTTGTITILGNTGHTYVGPATIGANASMSMMTIRTGVNTWTTYG